jgi:hypothetical protein
MLRDAIRILLMLALLGAGDQVSAIPRRAEAPLANLPSAPGDHVAKIEALADNAWLNLGAPAADPKWGGARGRSWSSNMSAAPELRGGFVFGEGVHGYTKPDGHYMNDLWFYDIQGHRWICLYPGIEVMTIAEKMKSKELKVDKHGLVVNKMGEPLPPLLIHAYGYLGYDPEQRKFAFLGSQFGNYFTIGKGGVFEEANQLFQEQRAGKSTRQYLHSSMMFRAANSVATRSTTLRVDSPMEPMCWFTSTAASSSSMGGRMASGSLTPQCANGSTPSRKATRPKVLTTVRPTIRNVTASTTTAAMRRPRMRTSSFMMSRAICGSGQRAGR